MHRDDEPERGVHRVELGCIALVHEAVRQHALGYVGGPLEQDEARFVVERIREYIEGGGHASDVAVLYRSNAQSRNFEEQLHQHDVPYRVYGGQRYFERAEVKDALAYLRLAANRGDDASFERALATPPHGVGERTVEALRRRARGDDTPLWDASLAELADSGLTTRAKNALRGFMTLVDALSSAPFQMESPATV